jgi:4-amino-4-deoxy-L-arabinose transferase-like glycosyltransferase
MSLLEIDCATSTELARSERGSSAGHRPPDRPAFARRLWRGRPADPVWVRPALLALLAGTAVIYLINLSSAGWSNSFYSAAVQAGTKSWEAFFFGSSDAANLVSVDKPPMALWVMDLSARMFGLNPWSVLVPQALEGVACVGLVYATVRRAWSAAAGLLAGLLLSLTPVAAVMFRFNNPDALLVLVLVGSAYATVRAVESGRLPWLLLAGVLVGVGFNTKMLQAFLVVPALGACYLAAGRPGLGRRLIDLVAAGAAMAVSSAWWVVVVDLIPRTDRPYVGGSTNDMVTDLIFGYNGIGRLNGTETGSVAFTGPASSGGGTPGPFRMFDHGFGGDVAWLIPAAVLGLVLVLYLTRHTPRTDVRRAQALLWGLWLVVTAGAFSLGRGIIHPYYSVALAPAVACLVAPAVTTLLARRHERRARWTLAVGFIVTLGCADLLVTQVGGGFALQAACVGLATLMAAGIVAAPALRRASRSMIATVAVVLCLGGPVAGTISAASSPQTSAIPAAGGIIKSKLDAVAARSNWIIESVKPSSSVVAILDGDARRYTWAAAATGSERAASYQLATGRPVMSVGGFNGTDPVPTLHAFQADVAAHRVHWFIGGWPGLWQGGADAAAITAWVQRSFPVHVVDGVWLYDLSVPSAGSAPMAGSGGK